MLGPCYLNALHRLNPYMCRVTIREVPFSVAEIASRTEIALRCAGMPSCVALSVRSALSASDTTLREELAHYFRRLKTQREYAYVGLRAPSLDVVRGGAEVSKTACHLVQYPTRQLISNSNVDTRCAFLVLQAFASVLSYSLTRPSPESPSRCLVRSRGYLQVLQRSLKDRKREGVGGLSAVCEHA